MALLYLMRIASIIVLGFYNEHRGGGSMSKNWWKAAGIRAIKTFAQVAAATIGAGAISPIHEIDWIYCLSISATAAVLSLLTSLGGLPEVEDDKKI